MSREVLFIANFVFSFVGVLLVFVGGWMLGRAKRAGFFPLAAGTFLSAFLLAVNSFGPSNVKESRWIATPKGAMLRYMPEVNHPQAFGTPKPVKSEVE